MTASPATSESASIWATTGAGLQYITVPTIAAAAIAAADFPSLGVGAAAIAVLHGAPAAGVPETMPGATTTATATAIGTATAMATTPATTTTTTTVTEVTPTDTLTAQA